LALMIISLLESKAFAIDARALSFVSPGTLAMGIEAAFASFTLVIKLEFMFYP